MLVLKRKEGQWVEIHHRSGDVIRLRVYGICSGVPGRVNLAFDDPPRHFEIRRPERRPTEPAATPVLDLPAREPQIEACDLLSPLPFDSAVPVVFTD